MNRPSQCFASARRPQELIRTIRRQALASPRRTLHAGEAALDLVYPIRWVDGEDARQVKKDGQAGDVLSALEESDVGGVHPRVAAERDERPSPLVAQAAQNRTN